MFNQLNFIKYIEFNTKADAISAHGSKVLNEAVRVFTGSDLITGSDRIGPDRVRILLFSSFLKHFFIIIMFIKYVYDHNNDVWIIKVGDDSYYLTGSGPKMVK